MYDEASSSTVREYVTLASSVTLYFICAQYHLQRRMDSNHQHTGIGPQFALHWRTPLSPQWDSNPRLPSRQDGTLPLSYEVMVADMRFERITLGYEPSKLPGCSSLLWVQTGSNRHYPGKSRELCHSSSEPAICNDHCTF